MSLPARWLRLDRPPSGRRRSLLPRREPASRRRRGGSGALRLALLLLLVAGAAGPLPAQAQVRPRREIHRTTWGRELDFAPDGVWRKPAAAVAARRQRLLALGQFEALNAPIRGAWLRGAAPAAAAGAATAVAGTYRVPVILFRFKDAGTAAASFDPLLYGQVLFGSPPPLGRPYSLRTYYEELSNGLLSIQGQAFGWTTLDSNEVTYTGVAGTCTQNPPNNLCNGLFSSDAFGRMQRGLTEALAKLDGQIDFSQYDADGDGFVDLVVFVQSEQDGACGGSTNNHLWAHRATLSTPYTTGEGVKVRDYILQSGLGGATACDTTQVMPVGTVAHETGHGFGLPDLYDTGLQSEGIGEWGLMGSGNYTSPLSPSRMEAWSLVQLGWITVRPLASSGTYQVGAVPVADTTFYLRVQGANPRGEYFLLENRQAVQADTAMIRIHCERSRLAYPAGCGGGLLVWHVDSAKVAQGAPFNTVNSGSIHGVALVQADNRADLDKATSAGGNRGDAGDPYPGTADNRRLGYNSLPAARKNSDSSYAGFELDSIAQVVPGGTMQFKLTIAGPTVVQATDTLAKVKVDGVAYGRFARVLTPGTVHSLDMDSLQVSADSLARWAFQSWSDGGPRSHSFTAQVAGDSIAARVSKAYRLRVRLAGPGTGSVTATPAGDSATLAQGKYLPQDSTVKLKAVPAGGSVFEGWAGDTTTQVDSLILTMSRAYSLQAQFVPLLAAQTPSPPAAVMGQNFSYQLTATGGTGSYSWQLASGALPDGLALSASGLVSGIPSKVGSFSAALRVTSGSQRATVNLVVAVTAPVLATGDVVAQLLGTRSPLSADQLRYLDLLGNRNGQFDAGDFLAWVQATGAPAPPAVLSAMQSEPPPGPAGRAAGRPAGRAGWRTP